jgi:hypothetical protein
LLLLATLSDALPNLERRRYGITTLELKPEYQEWYSEKVQGANAENPGITEDNFEVTTELVNSYQCMGPLMRDFPALDDWPLTFEQLWQINVPEITKKNGGKRYNGFIKNAILKQSKKNKVDSRLILVMMMQEVCLNLSPTSPPKKKAYTTLAKSTGELTPTPICSNNDQDCGLLQCRGCRVFDPNDPKGSIQGMIRDGVEGIPAWPGYLTYFNGDTGVNVGKEGTWWYGNPWAAAHIYNQGNLVDENLTKRWDPADQDRYGPSTYAHDLAARLWGWDGLPIGCEKSRECPKLGFDRRGSCYM